MKKNLILVATLLTSSIAFSQVGVNTNAPQATLDVVASPNSSSKVDGFIAPRLKGSELKSKDNLYNAAQDGTIVYVTEALASSSVSDRTTNVTSIGYYYFDKNKSTNGRWMKLTSDNDLPSGIDLTNDEWINDSGNAMLKVGKNADGSTRAANTDFVFKDDGKTGIGTNSPISRLHISGENNPIFTIRGNSSTSNTDAYAQGEINWFEPNTKDWGIKLKFFSPSGSTGSPYGGNSNFLSFFSTANGTDTPILTVRAKLDNDASEIGRIGIGTQNPAYLLDVQAGLNKDPFRLKTLNPGNNTDNILTVNSDGVVRQVSGSTFAPTYVEPWNKVGGTPATSNTDDIYQLGKVGINTNSPSNNLHVKGTSPGNNEVIVKVEDNNMSSGNKVLIKLGKNDSGKKDAADIKYYYDADNSNSNRIDFGFSGNSESMSLTSQGNFGIGTNAPANRLHVTATSDPVKLDGLQSGASTDQIVTVGSDGVLKKSAVVPSGAYQEPWSITSSTTPATTNTQNIYQNANIGIGNFQSSNPSQQLHVKGNTRLEGQIYDNNNVQGANGQVLSTNSSGKVAWVNNVAITPSVAAVFPRTTQHMTWDQSGQTGTTLTLPPGKWSIQVAILIDTTISDAGSAGWFRTSFSDSPTSTSATSDFVGATKASGAITGPAQFGLVSGTVIINNTSGASKTYYLVKQVFFPYKFGNAQDNWLAKDFGRGVASEDQIIAYPMN
ncbi:hypothetical protein [Chryseobacterium sp.]|uniref:hypothetical protein n=1 Tax=Chryseobacterium sp. TaxID=1871047 RepID=UPI002896AA9E|nr:hypothetical protein [Chryseobacterium sp.]